MAAAAGRTAISATVVCNKRRALSWAECSAEGRPGCTGGGTCGQTAPSTGRGGSAGALRLNQEGASAGLEAGLHSYVGVRCASGRCICRGSAESQQGAHAAAPRARPCSARRPRRAAAAGRRFAQHVYGGACWNPGLPGSAGCASWAQSRPKRSSAVSQTSPLRSAHLPRGWFRNGGSKLSSKVTKEADQADLSSSPRP